MRPPRLVRLIALLAAAAAAAPPAAAAEDDPWTGRTAAFFGVAFLDTSTEGELFGAREDEAARVAMIEAQLREALVANGLTLVDLAPIETELARIINPADCNDCDLRFAARLGADYAVVSEVQKVSNLILAINVDIREAATGRRVRGLAVDIRGNTDESWTRGMRYILERGVFAE